jgi:hypothetical protein
MGRRTKAMRQMANPERGEFIETRKGAMITIRAGLGILLNPAKSQHLDDKSYAQMMASWGIDRGNRDNVVRGHYVEMFLFSLLILLGFYQLFVGLFGDAHGIMAASRVIGGLLILLAGLIRISILVWRVDIIKNEYWITYARWIRGGQAE